MKWVYKNTWKLQVGNKMVFSIFKIVVGIFFFFFWQRRWTRRFKKIFLNRWGRLIWKTSRGKTEHFTDHFSFLSEYKNTNSTDNQFLQLCLDMLKGQNKKHETCAGWASWIGCRSSILAYESKFIEFFFFFHEGKSPTLIPMRPWRRKKGNI